MAEFFSSFNDTEAKTLGINEAIIVFKVRQWLSHAKANLSNFNDGKYWVYNTIEAWQEMFPWWSKNTIIRTLERLEQLGVVLVGNYNKSTYDRTKWYSLQDGYFDHTNTGKSNNPKRETPFTQNEQMEAPKMGNTIPLEYSLESNTNNTLSETTYNRQPTVLIPQGALNLLREERRSPEAIAWVSKQKNLVNDLLKAFPQGSGPNEIYNQLAGCYEQNPAVADETEQMLEAAAKWPKVKEYIVKRTKVDKFPQYSLAGWIKVCGWRMATEYLKEEKAKANRVLQPAF